MKTTNKAFSGAGGPHGHTCLKLARRTSFDLQRQVREYMNKESITRRMRVGHREW